MRRERLRGGLGGGLRFCRAGGPLVYVMGGRG